MILTVAYLQVQSPVLVVELNLDRIEGTQLRALGLLAVYGFNVTYEVRAAAQAPGPTSCSAIECRLLGHCYARQDYKEFYCSCFDGYSGADCGVGPLCPTTSNMCKNGGTCRQMGPAAVSCICAPGYTGDVCEAQVAPPECGIAECAEVCKDGTACDCNPKDTDALSARFETRLQVVGLPNENISDEIAKQLTQFLKASNITLEDDVQVLNTSLTTTEGVRDAWVRVWSSRREAPALRAALARLASARTRLLPTSTHFDMHPALSLHKLVVNQRPEVWEGSEFILTCMAYGSPSMAFTWYKDSVKINFNGTTRDIWTRTVSEDALGRRMSVLGVTEAERLDSGKWSCAADDAGRRRCRALRLTVLRPPEIRLVPSTLTVNRVWSCDTVHNSIATDTAFRQWRRSLQYSPSYCDLAVYTLEELQRHRFATPGPQLACGSRSRSSPRVWSTHTCELRVQEQTYEYIACRCRGLATIALFTVDSLGLTDAESDSRAIVKITVSLGSAMCLVAALLQLLSLVVGSKTRLPVLLRAATAATHSAAMLTLLECDTKQVTQKLPPDRREYVRERARVVRHTLVLLFTTTATQIAGVAYAQPVEKTIPKVVALSVAALANGLAMLICYVICDEECLRAARRLFTLSSNNEWHDSPEGDASLSLYIRQGREMECRGAVGSLECSSSHVSPANTYWRATPLQSPLHRCVIRRGSSGACVADIVRCVEYKQALLPPRNVHTRTLCDLIPIGGAEPRVSRVCVELGVLPEASQTTVTDASTFQPPSDTSDILKANCTLCAKSTPDVSATSTAPRPIKSCLKKRSPQLSWSTSLPSINHESDESNIHLQLVDTQSQTPSTHTTFTQTDKVLHKISHDLDFLLNRTPSRVADNCPQQIEEAPT
ncbi:unnamed protein product [Spodoptera exigua]|nr:unnamed protein product [Spodoptera exigua]